MSGPERLAAAVVACLASMLASGCSSGDGESEVYAIVDLMVSDKSAATVSSGEPEYTGIAGRCSEPFVPGVVGVRQLAPFDVNVGIGGTTTTIWARYAAVSTQASTRVLADVAVKHWVDWNVKCPDGWEHASGTSSTIPGGLTTRVQANCWRNGLCVKYVPMNELRGAPFVTNLSLTQSSLGCGEACSANGEAVPMQRDALDIHTACLIGDPMFLCKGSQAIP